MSAKRQLRSVCCADTEFTLPHGALSYVLTVPAAWTLLAACRTSPSRKTWRCSTSCISGILHLGRVRPRWGAAKAVAVLLSAPGGLVAALDAAMQPMDSLEPRSRPWRAPDGFAATRRAGALLSIGHSISGYPKSRRPIVQQV